MFQRFKTDYTLPILTLFFIVLTACGAPTATNIGYSYAPEKPKSGRKKLFSQSDNTASIPKSRRKSNQKKRVARLYPAPGNSSKKAVFGPILNKSSAVQLINSYRIEHNLPPLRYSKKLEKAAQLHSRDMAKIDMITHRGSNGSDPWDRIVSSGYPPDMATENIGGGINKFTELFELWKASKQHNANLLIPDATDMGLALVHDRDAKIKTYWTLVIAKQGS